MGIETTKAEVLRVIDRHGRDKIGECISWYSEDLEFWNLQKQRLENSEALPWTMECVSSLISDDREMLAFLNNLQYNSSLAITRH